MHNVVPIIVTILLVAILFPVAFMIIFNTDTSNWDNGTSSIFFFIPVVAPIEIILILVLLAVRDRD